ncbi:ANTAR domain-containing protein [Streptomyces sp. NPDC001828]|uniref:ANTAR domain-containing protein n=1 Tax=Streptomyces sp. NPDC001828 TaxID=3364615 RepID=UPI0036B02E05
MPRCEQDGAGPTGTCGGPAGFAGAHRLSGLTVFSRPDGDRTVVSVCGELDLDADHRLLHALRHDSAASDASGAADASEATPSGETFQLDVGGVDFRACSGVDLLLIVKRHGLDPDHDEPPSPHPDGADDPDADLRLELDQLRRAMRSRGTIDLARGILMAAFGLSPDEAWKVLVSTSQHTNTKLRRLAEQVVDSAGGTPLPEPVRKQLAAAVAQEGKEAREARAASSAESQV